MVEGNNEKSMSLIVLNCDEPFFSFCRQFFGNGSHMMPLEAGHS